jgi:guanylate kinase
MDIDVQGTRQFTKVFPDSVLIFVLPPSVDALLARLRSRNSESPESLTRRLRTALGEIDAVHEYEYVVVNEDLAAATALVSSIIDAEASRGPRIQASAGRVGRLLEDLRRDILLHVQET